MSCHPLTVITFIGIIYNEAAKLGCRAASCRLACRSKRQLGKWPDRAPAEAPRKQEPGPHGARSQFYPTQQANAGRIGDSRAVGGHSANLES
jgi:hypothetical protein